MSCVAAYGRIEHIQSIYKWYSATHIAENLSGSFRISVKEDDSIIRLIVQRLLLTQLR